MPVMVLDVGRLSTRGFHVLCFGVFPVFCRALSYYKYREGGTSIFCVLWCGCACVGRGCRELSNASPDFYLRRGGKTTKITIMEKGEDCRYSLYLFQNINYSYILCMDKGCRYDSAFLHSCWKTTWHCSLYICLPGSVFRSVDVSRSGVGRIRILILKCSSPTAGEIIQSTRM